MAILLANPDGTSSAKAGDVVVTGGGIFKKNPDGTSTKVQALPTTTGKSSDYNVISNIWREMTGIGGNDVAGTSTTKPTNVIDDMLNKTQVFDSATNYDSFTTPDYSSYSTVGSGSSFSLSNVFGYVIVGLVLLVVADKFIGGGK